MITKITNSTMNQYLGLSTDAKPTDDVPTNSLFLELDTKTVFYFDGTTWQAVGGE